MYERVPPELLLKLHKAVPRYTSYPTAPEWGPLLPDLYVEKLQELAQDDSPLSLYFHVPFCHSMCLFCGCSVILNRNPVNEKRYVDYLMRELDLVVHFLGKGKRVTQLHFGGGTPTKLSEELLLKLFNHITSLFTIDFSKEIAIEIDPRTVVADKGKKLRLLKELGFNRVSFGVQDTNTTVQAAVKRHQTLEMTLETYALARSLGFQSINLDLIYGLPFQTLSSFRLTIEHILKMRPDRIALFSYAKVPWLKSHQKAIAEKDLPTALEKFEIYAEARSSLIENGYVGIGMDHFALAEDELTKSYQKKNLQRNFQGYTRHLADNMLGFGVTSIGFVRNAYIQNLKELSDYYTAIDRRELPIHRGKILTPEDLVRKWVVHTLMCNFELNKRLFEQKFGWPFDHFFALSLPALHSLEADGLLIHTQDKVTATPLGELFIRSIASVFDSYFKENSSLKFSQSV